jgi:hypothetical protein
MARALFVSACLFAVVGCGGGGSRPATNDCEDYVENFLCPAVQSCPESLYSSFGDCVSFFENGYYNCGSALEGPGLAVCESDTNAYSCSELFNSSYAVVPPDSCAGVFY